MHDCGGCVHFLKLKNAYGLCQHDDRKTKSDFGHKCKAFKRPKTTKPRAKKDDYTMRQLKNTEAEWIMPDHMEEQQ